MSDTTSQRSSSLVDAIKQMSVEQVRSMPRVASSDYEATGSDTGVLRVRRTQDVEQILKAIHEIPDHMSRRSAASSGMKYVGSIPNLIAVHWATESGTRLYSKEWLAYARNKMDDPTWAKLKVSYK